MSSTPRPAFQSGFWDRAPFMIIVLSYNILFGVVARDDGLAACEVMSMSMSIFVMAGASQLTALALMEKHAPVIAILAAALAVNLRVAMYFAALVPHRGHLTFSVRALIAYMMVDQSVALSVKKFDEEPGCLRRLTIRRFVCRFAALQTFGRKALDRAIALTAQRSNIRGIMVGLIFHAGQTNVPFAPPDCTRCEKLNLHPWQGIRGLKPVSVRYAA